MPPMGSTETTFPVRVAVQVTGLSAERLRAWESRHGAVQPVRTPGGSRRYRAADLERLSLLRAAVEAGRRIGDLAGMGEEELRGCLASALEARDETRSAEAIWGPLSRLEVDVVRDQFESRRSVLGTLEFARAFALPFLYEVGRRWAAGELSVAAEHLASNLLSSMLGVALHAGAAKRSGPVIVFATPPGERHSLGLCVAALAAADAGGDPIFLGADVPELDLVESAVRVRAAALALGFVSLSDEVAEGLVRRIRERLPARIEIWIGGPGAPRCAPIRGVERIANLDQLAPHVARKRLARDGQFT